MAAVQEPIRRHAAYDARMIRARSAPRLTTLPAYPPPNAPATDSDPTVVRNLDTGEILDVGTVEHMYRNGPASAFEWVHRAGGVPDLSNGLAADVRIDQRADDVSSSTSSASATTAMNVQERAPWWRRSLALWPPSRATVTNESQDEIALCVRVLKRCHEIKNSAAATRNAAVSAAHFGDFVKGMQVLVGLFCTKRAQESPALQGFMLTAELLCRDTLQACARIFGPDDAQSSALRVELIRLLRAKSKEAAAEELERLEEESRRRRAVQRCVEEGRYFDAFELGWDGDMSVMRERGLKG